MKFFIISTVAGLVFHFVAKSNNNITSLPELKSNEELIQSLIDKNILSTPCVIEAFKNVDRKFYVHSLPPKYEYLNPHEDKAQPIEQNATISAPHMHCQNLEILFKQFSRYTSGEKVNLLDVGCGSGFICSCLSQIMKYLSIQNFTVYGVDLFEQLVELAARNISNDPNNCQFLANNSIQLFPIDCFDENKFAEKFGNEMQFDIIHVGASKIANSDEKIKPIEDLIPSTLKKSLKVGGVMVLPIGFEDQFFQTLYAFVKKSDSEFLSQPISRVRFIPLSTSQQNQLERSNSSVRYSVKGTNLQIAPFVVNSEFKDFKNIKWTTADDL